MSLTELMQPCEGWLTMTETTGKSWDVELALISGIVTSEKALGRLRENLDPEDFTYKPYQRAYKAALFLAEDNIPVNLINLSDQLQREHWYDDFKIHNTSYEGDLAVSRLGDGFHKLSDIESYATQLRDYTAKRRLLVLANQLASGAVNGKTGYDIIRETEKVLGTIAVSRGVKSNGVKSMRDVAISASEEAEKARFGNLSVLSGLIDLDNLLGGFYKGDMILVAARPGVGKSSLLATIALNAAENNKRIGMFSLEMRNEDVFHRMISQKTSIPMNIIRAGKMSTEQWEQYYAAMDELSKLPLQWDDTPAITAVQLRQSLRYMARSGVDLIMLDYIQLMQAVGQSRENREQQVTKISQAVKQVAREFDIPILAAAQMSRAVESRADKEPELSDLRESGSLEQDADVVMFLYQNKDAPNIKNLKIAKHRNGPTGTVNLLFMDKQTRFTNAASRTIDFSAEPRQYKD
jgi:replicative DNA helicase